MKQKLLDLKIYIIAFFVITPLVWKILNIRENSLLEKQHKYTIAEITKITGGGKTSGMLKYSFEIKNTFYKGKFNAGISNLNFLHTLKKKQFFVMYYPENPKVNKLMICYPVPENFNVTVNIWNSIPNLDFDSERNKLRLEDFECWRHY